MIGCHLFGAKEACCVPQKLEKAKEKWHKAARQRAKEREARQRAVTEAEKAKARAKAAAEEEVLRCLFPPLCSTPFLSVWESCAQRRENLLGTVRNESVLRRPPSSRH